MRFPKVKAAADERGSEVVPTLYEWANRENIPLSPQVCGLLSIGEYGDAAASFAADFADHLRKWTRRGVVEEMARLDGVFPANFRPTENQEGQIASAGYEAEARAGRLILQAIKSAD